MLNYVSVFICATKLDQRRNCLHPWKKIQFSRHWKRNWVGRKEVDLIETPRDKGFPKSQSKLYAITVRGVPYFVVESSRRSRARKSSKDKWGCRILRCGRFPSGFPGNTRDAWRTCRGDTAARIREFALGVPRECRATLVPVYTDYQSKTRYLMRSFPEKPQRNEEQHATMRTAEGNDTLGMEPSIILRRFASALAWLDPRQFMSA